MDWATAGAALALVVSILLFAFAAAVGKHEVSQPPVIGGEAPLVRESRFARVNSARQAHLEGMPAVAVWSIATGQMTREQAAKLVSDLTD